MITDAMLPAFLGTILQEPYSFRPTPEDVSDYLTERCGDASQLLLRATPCQVCGCRQAIYFFRGQDIVECLRCFAASPLGDL